MNKLKVDFQAIYNEAHQSGVTAANAKVPTPMVVQQHANQLDDNSPVVKQWVIAEGPCGFVWISFKGNTAWAKWAKKNTVAKDMPNEICIYQFGQSLEMKENYAYAFVEVLNKHGIIASVNSRMD